MSVQSFDLSVPLEATVLRRQALDRPAHSSLYARRVKPLLDVATAAVLLVLLVPVLLAVTVAVRLRLGKGVLYRQERVGRGGSTFTVLKFRTMLLDRRATTAPVTEDRRVSHKTQLDPRHTALGRFLRKWSLDELPQLINVLRGEMSIIGPRPELVSVVDRYGLWDHDRHLVRPGLTGLWQTQARAAGPTHQFVHLDLQYVERLSVLNDLRILLATPSAALGAQKGT